MKKRKIRVTTTCFEVPRNLSLQHPLTRERNLKAAERYLKKAGEMKSDIVLLPECFGVKGIKEMFGPIAKAAEEIPEGPSCRIASRFAEKYKMYVIAPIIEKDKGKVYNTAVIFDRRGKVFEKYRKTHLPKGEKGILCAGRSLPVFDLDFGRIAVCICYDLNFPEVATTLSRKGAEILFWPTMWGTSKDYVTAYMRGMAVANIFYFVSALYAMPVRAAHPGQSMIIDPKGTVLANTGNRPGVASAMVDLEMKCFFNRKQLRNERMPALYSPLSASESGRGFARHSSKGEGG